MRSLWTGAISFGLVNIPVKLYSAVQASELDLDMLDKKDHSNIRFRRVNEKTGKEVPWQQIVRAYNYKGKYVVLSDEDFQKASPEKTKTIDIVQFVEQQEVDSLYFETPYYLEPAKGGEKAYVLLREALEKTGKTALASFVLRTKETLSLIKPLEKTLVLQRIRYEEEIRERSELKLPSYKIKPQELKMAVHLIDQLSGKFDISQYKDSYSHSLLKLIASKAKGKKYAVPTMKVVHSRSDNLMEQLRASLETKKKKAS